MSTPLFPKFKRNFSSLNTCFNSRSLEGLMVLCIAFPTFTFPVSSLSCRLNSRFSLYRRSEGLDTTPACIGIHQTVNQHFNFFFLFTNNGQEIMRDGYSDFFPEKVM
ncbi:hypothetical protein V8G54_022131 [Vigna mungo]|uniref:Uncharacterized protein n=1 Tax=Vigna mungo TaxID=3915 RepID=A0AAQ3NH01_VIGMU